MKQSELDKILAGSKVGRSGAGSYLGDRLRFNNRALEIGVGLAGVGLWRGK